MYLSSVLVVEVNSLFADHRMTEQSLRISTTLKYGRHIEFVNLNPGLSHILSFHMQKHGCCNYPLGVTPVTTTATAVQNSIENPEATLCELKQTLCQAF